MTARRSQLLTIGFLIVLVALTGAGYGVFRAAQTAVLESQSGSISEFTLDPSAPGFRAFTEATPTALVIHTAVSPGIGAELVGATLLTAADGDSGGTVVTIPRTFIDPGNSNIALSELFAAEGLDAVTNELRSTLGIGFGDVVVLDASSWTTLMTADLPLLLSLRTDLVVLSEDGESRRVLLAEGTREFNLPEIARIAAHRNPGEPSLAVALRHQQIWQAWIARTAGTDERPDLFQLESGFVDLIATLASDEVSYRVVPTVTQSEPGGEETRYVAVPSAIAELVSAIVPFPEQAFPGDRPSVLLLDSSGGEVDQAPVVSSITRAGGLVTILGNSESGADRTSEVLLHDAEASDVAASIAQILELPAPRSAPLDDSTASITVVIG